MIKTYKILCSECQFEITIPHYMKRLTCHECGSILKINEVGGIQTVTKIGHSPLIENQQNIDNQSVTNEKKVAAIEILRLEKEIAMLDLEWFQKQEDFKVRTKWGDFIPTNEDTGKNGLIFFMFGIVILIIYLSNQINLFFVAIMIPIILILGFLSTINIFNVNDNYSLAKNIYVTKRRSLQEKIMKLENQFSAFIIG
jgi:ribosomal protein S27E